jgi:hypothetical protein
VSRAAFVAILLALGGPARADETPLRDPMRPFNSAPAAAGEAIAAAPRFALTGVLISPTRRVAFLNGKPYAQGDVVDGAEIVAIEPGAVHLRERGEALVISLGQRERARPSNVQGETAQ